MRFSEGQHGFYAGVDLHARTLHVCVLDAKGKVARDTNTAANPDPFLRAVAPRWHDLVVGCECMFCWYWLADLCQQEKVPFVGHALDTRLIHGAKAKSDRIDARTLARPLEGGNFPLSDVYPKGMRAYKQPGARGAALARCDPTAKPIGFGAPGAPRCGG